MASIFSFWSGLHRSLARLHGGSGAFQQEIEAHGGESQEFSSVYAAYAESVVKAAQALRLHGKNSAEFATADIASMRLFHRAKKMQGLKKPKPN